MKKRTSIFSVTIAVLIMVSVCAYFIRVNSVYNGAVDVCLSVWVITLPIVGAMQLWQISSGKSLHTSPQKRWQKIVFLCIMACFCLLALWMLYDNPYSLPAIILLMIALIGFVSIFLEKLKKTESRKVSIQQSAIISGSFYLLAALTVFGYIQIVQPISVSEAEILVGEKYGADSYQFIGRLDYDAIQAENPLGVYYFAPSADGNPITLQVSVIGGKIAEQ